VTANIDALTFDTTGWTSPEEEAMPGGIVRRWRNDFEDQLTVQYFDSPDAPPFRVGDVAEFRGFARAMATNRGGGLIDANVVSGKGVRLHRVVMKYPDAGGGFSFVGGLILSPHFSINVEGSEGPVTGERETAVALSLGADAKPGLLKRMLGRGDPWAQDPYEPSFRAPVLRCKADDSRWDAEFPTHALSRVRAALLLIQRTASLSPDG